MTGVLETIRSRLAAHRPRRLAVCDAAEAAVAVLVSATKDGCELLFIRRAIRSGDPWSGHVGLPGGRHEPRDPNLYQTVLRETLEETSIALSGELLMGELNDLHPMTKSLPPVIVRPYVFGLPQRPAVVLNEELTSHFWIDARELVRLERRTAVESRGSILNVDAYVVGTNVIWGITYRIIKDFLNLVNG
jgi:8-oxo-dGTP pyrophosphatase MutT (NUDIX family)